MKSLLRIPYYLNRKRKLWELKRQYRSSNADLVVDYKWIRLPFTNDGDLQELYYHMNCDAWYADERSILQDHVKTGANVIDVGGNMGFMAAIFAELIGPEGHVFAFEPSPKIFKKLERVIALNGLSTVEPLNCGCGAQPGRLSLYQVGPSSGNASLVPEEQDTALQTKEEVEIVKLDDFVRSRMEKVDFIKIDTEGYESEVLKGAIETLKRDKPGLYVELSQEYKDSSLETIRMLRDLGYEFVEDPDLNIAHNGANFIALHSETSARVYQEG